MADCGRRRAGVNLTPEVMVMTIFGRLAGMVADLLNYRRQRWVEISVTRAWSRDMAPRLFDLSD